MRLTARRLLTQCTSSRGIRLKAIRKIRARRPTGPREPDRFAAALSIAFEGKAAMLWRVRTSFGFVQKHSICALGQRRRVCSMTACRVHSLPRLPAPKCP